MSGRYGKWDIRFDLIIAGVWIVAAVFCVVSKDWWFAVIEVILALTTLQVAALKNEVNQARSSFRWGSR